MPINLNDGFRLAAPRYEDLRQGQLVAGVNSAPYASSAAANTAIPITRRAEGLIVYVSNGAIVEQWQYVGGIADINLVKIFDSNGISTGSPLRFGKSGEDITAAETRLFNVNGHTFTIQANSNDCIAIDPVNFQTFFGATNGTGFSSFVLNSDVVGNNVQFALTTTDNINLVQITGDAIAQIINLGAATGVEINSAYLLPPIDGSADQVLTTDGAGTVTWQNGGGGGGGSTLFALSGTNTATGGVLGELNGNILAATNTGNAFFVLEGTLGSELSSIRSQDAVGNAEFSAISNIGSGYTFAVSADDSVNLVQIVGNAATNIIQHTAATHIFNGLLKGSSYGGGTNTGTPTFGTAFDSAGNVIEVALGGGGNTIYTADDSLISDRTVDLNGKFLYFQNNGDNLFQINPETGSEFARFRLFNNLGPGQASIELHANPSDGDNILIQAIDSTGTKTPNIFVDGENNTITYTADTHEFTGLLKADNYGSGANTGTPTFLPAFNAAGNIIEVAISNGLSINGGSGDVQLGGVLKKDTTINTDDIDAITPHNLTIRGSLNTTILELLNTGTGAALDVSSSNGLAMTISSTNQPCINAQSTNSSTGVGGFLLQATSVDTIENVFELSRVTSGTPLAGLGGKLKLSLMKVGGLNVEAGAIQWSWDDPNSITPLGRIDLTINNSSVLSMAQDGTFTLPKGLQNFANNGAAITGGLITGNLYRNGDVVQIVH